jgi:hypothetical protein
VFAGCRGANKSGHPCAIKTGIMKVKIRFRLSLLGNNHKGVRPGVGAAWHRQGVTAQWISVSASGKPTGRRGGGAQDSTLPLRPYSTYLRTVGRACPCLVPVSYLSRTSQVQRVVLGRNETGTRPVPGRHALAGPSPLQADPRAGVGVRQVWRSFPSRANRRLRPMDRRSAASRQCALSCGI